MKPSERYRADADALREFREAYVRLLNASMSYDATFVTQLGPGVPPEEWAVLRSHVASACGEAIPAYERHGGMISLRNAAYVVSDMNPLLNWEYSLRDPEQLSPEHILTAVETAAALAERQSKEAAQSERGVLGLLAWFLRWPSELRAAVGPEHTGQRRAAGALGITLQIFVGTIAGILGTLILAAAAAAWRALT